MLGQTGGLYGRLFIVSKIQLRRRGERGRKGRETYKSQLEQPY
jgi:hypothetical protein